MTDERRIEQNDRMGHDLSALSDDVLGFLRERHLATLTTLRADWSPHVVPVGFGYDPDERVVRIITFVGPRKPRTSSMAAEQPCHKWMVVGG